MGDPQKSQPSAAATDLTSSQDDPQGKLQDMDMEKSLGNIIEKTQKFELQTSILEPLRASSGIPVQPGSPRPTMSSAAAELTTAQYRALTKLSDVLSAQLSVQLSAQLDSQKSILEELRLIRASNAITFQSERRKTPNFTVPDREPFNPYPSFSMVEDASTVNQGEDRSVYLLVSFYDGRYTDSIYQVTFKHGGVTHEPPVVEHEEEFYDGFYIQGARISNRSKLYVLLQNGYNNPLEGYSRVPSGYSIEPKTWSYHSSLPPNITSKPLATLVSAYDKLYYIASPVCLPPIKEPSFERYDPTQNRWERMPSFPFYHDDRTRMEIIGYAVCYGVILFSLWDSDLNPNVVAFHERINQWSQVTSASYAPFRGMAVVVGDTIYAVHALMVEQIIAFSFKMDKGEHGHITYSLSPLFILRGLEIACPPVPLCELKTGYLVHLSNHDFFHVMTGSPNSEAHPEVQYLCITTFQIVVGEGGRPMIKTIQSTVHPVNIKGRDWFFLEFCFKL
ncbi:hypothetical protein ACE6H2_018227 [Prunus campanulata]